MPSTSEVMVAEGLQEAGLFHQDEAVLPKLPAFKSGSTVSPSFETGTISQSRIRNGENFFSSLDLHMTCPTHT